MKFEIISGSINITDARLDRYYPNSNLWEIKARNGIWIVDSPENGEYLKITHCTEKPASKDDIYDSISVDCGMITICDSSHHNDMDADVLHEMINDDFGHCLLLPHGILADTLSGDGVHEIYARTNQAGEVVAIFIDFEPEDG